MSNSTVQNSFANRIKQLLAEYSNGNYSDFARKIGVSPPSVKRWVENGYEPSRAVLVDMSERLNIDLVWLMTGKGNQDGTSSATELLSVSDDEYRDVPVYNLAASAGSGRLVTDENIENYLKFPYWWFNERNLTPSNIAALYTKGDSMEPTIPDNALLLIDQSKTYLSDGKIYIIRADDELYVKRIKRIIGGGIKLISDNTGYKPIELSKQLLTQENFFQVIGQIVHIGIDLPH